MNIKNFCTLLITLSLFYSSSFCTDVYAAHAVSPSMTADISNASSPAIAAPLKNDIGWRYKIVNGVMYKRQYDYTNQRWIGKWVKA